MIEAKAEEKGKVARFVALLGSLLFFLASFRAPGVTGEALTYSVPGPLAMIQNISLGMIGLVLIIIFVVYLYYREQFPNVKAPAGAIYYLIFAQIIALTEFYYSKIFPSLVVSFSFNIVVFIYFAYILKGYKFNKIDSPSFLKIAFNGIFAFVCLNLLLYFANIGLTSWKGRFYGLTGQPNFIGFCGGTLAVISFAIFFEAKGVYQKLLYFSGLVAGFLTSFLSQSRSSMLSALAGCAFILVMSLKTGIARFFTICICCSLGIYIIFNVDITSLDYTERGNTRENVWKVLESYARTFPILGFGMSKVPTTNSYLYAFVATGLIGSIFFFLGLFAILQRLLRLLPRSTDSMRTFFMGYGGLFMFFLVGAMFEGILLDSISIPIFVFWGLLVFSS